MHQTGKMLHSAGSSLHFVRNRILVGGLILYVCAFAILLRNKSFDPTGAVVVRDYGIQREGLRALGAVICRLCLLSVELSWRSNIFSAVAVLRFDMDTSPPINCWSACRFVLFGFSSKPD